MCRKNSDIIENKELIGFEKADNPEINILGIDPSIVCTGLIVAAYNFISRKDRLLYYKSILTPVLRRKNNEIGFDYEKLYTRILPILSTINDVLTEYKINYVCSEDLNKQDIEKFNIKNFKVLLKLQGNIEHICWLNNGYIVYYFNKSQMKAGLGVKAIGRQQEKERMIGMVKDKYGITEDIDDNVADAIGVANAFIKEI